MAKKNDSEASMANLRTILDDIKHDRFAQIYILHGEEAYYIDLISDAIEEKALPEEDRDFNQDIFYGPDADPDFISCAAKQFPVMANRRLVMLKEAQGMQQAKSSLEKFVPYIQNPSASTIFVIAFKGDALGDTSGLIKAARKSDAKIFKSEAPAPWNVETHARTYCQQHKISIDEKALNMMLESIGLPLSKLFGEIDKLVMIKGEGKQITPEDVERNIGISKDFTNMELSDAVARKDYPKAMKIVKYFETAKDTAKNAHAMTSAGTLYNYFSNLIVAHYLPYKTPEALKDELHLGILQARSVAIGLKNYSAMKAVNAMHYIREYDTKSKGVDSYFKNVDLLAELLFKIFT